MRNWILGDGLIHAGRFGYPVGRALRVVRDARHWSADEVREHQNASLRRMIRHCYENVPYYRQVMDDRGLRPEDVRSIEDLSLLPRLTRSTVLREGSRLLATDFEAARCPRRQSGGTTGEPLSVYLGRKARAFEVAAFIGGLRGMGYRFGHAQVMMFGGSLGQPASRGVKDALTRWLFNTVPLEGLAVTADNVHTYVEKLNGAVDGILLGYGSAVLNLVEAMAKRGFRGSPLTCVACTSEYIPPDWRTRIAEILGVPVYLYYGCGEVNSIAYEGAGHPGYRVCQEHVILEVAAEDTTAFCDTGRGEACITALFNYAMPLIRYCNDDVLNLAYCKIEGESRQIITTVEGRVADQLIRVDGHMVSSVMLPFLFVRGVFPVSKSQIVQEAPDRVVFRYEPRPGEGPFSPETEDRVTRILRKYLGEQMRVDFVRGEFELSSNGKHRMVVNRVNAVGLQTLSSYSMRGGETPSS